MPVDEIKNQVDGVFQCLDKAVELIAGIHSLQGLKFAFPLGVHLTAIATRAAPSGLRLINNDHVISIFGCMKCR